MHHIIVAPCDCPEPHLTAFERIVRTAEAVDHKGLGERIRRAFLLLFLRTPAGHLAGIAALKRPDVGCRDEVFRDAKSLTDPSLYTLELGWIAVAPAHRGFKLSFLMIAELLPRVGKELVFATTTEDKGAMQHALTDTGFKREGTTFRPKSGGNTLALYIRAS